MSLLLDALKRAAQEKLEKQRQDGEQAPDSADALSLEISDGGNEALTKGAVDGSDGDNMAEDDLRLHRSDVLASELQDFMGRTNTDMRRSNTEYTVEHLDP